MSAHAPIPGDWPSGTVAIIALPLPADQAAALILQLSAAYPGARLALDHDHPELLVVVA